MATSSINAVWSSQTFKNYLIFQPLAPGAYKNTLKKSKGLALLQEEQAVLRTAVHLKKKIKKIKRQYNYNNEDKEEESVE